MGFLLVSPDAAGQIAAINADQSPDRALTPRELVDGRLVLSDDLLGDCGDGQTWAAYAGVLSGLLPVEVQSGDWPVTSYPNP